MKADQDKSAVITAIRQITASIPAINLKVLNYLFQFLITVAEKDQINKMNFTNLAIVFGPNLLYAQDESLETILRIPKVNLVVSFMIENCNSIWTQ